MVDAEKRNGSDVNPDVEGKEYVDAKTDTGGEADHEVVENGSEDQSND